MRLPRLLLLLLPLNLCHHASGSDFPKLEDAKKIPGELVSADFVHRTGQFRTEKGELVEFALEPYGVMQYRGSEADLRDVPLGAKLDFFLLPDGEGRPSRLLTTQDEQASDPEQEKKFRAFTEKRGLAGWIDKTEGKTVTLTFFSGNPEAFQKAYGELLVKKKEIKLCVANDELRTWNPPVDGERGSIHEVIKLPTDRFGCSGFRITVGVPNMLEGFRRGRIVRVFLAGWKAEDQFYGESLMGYGFGRMMNQELIENAAKEYPDQFPFRTDYGNYHLPWYKLQEGVKPPPFAEHVVLGEIVKTDAAARTGQFRTEGSGAVVDFTLAPAPVGAVKSLNADATLGDLPPGTRCRFHLFQDEKGAFTKATYVCDSFSHLSANATTFRVLALHLDKNKVHVAWQLPEVKDYNGDMQRPPDFGWSELRVSPETKVWKGDKQVALTDLAVGDVLLANVTGELPDTPSRCTDVWIGEETHKQVTAQRTKKPTPSPGSPKPAKG